MNATREKVKSNKWDYFLTGLMFGLAIGGGYYQLDYRVWISLA